MEGMFLRLFERRDLSIVEENAEIDAEYVHDVACHTDIITECNGVNGGKLEVRHEKQQIPGNLDEVRIHLGRIERR